VVTNGYTTVALVKAEVGITDSADDTRLDRIVTAVSRQIDDYLGAHVYSSSATRYFSADSSELVLTDPFYGTPTVAYDSAGDWSAYTAITTVYPWPANADAHERPFTGIALTPGASTGFPVGNVRGVRVTATFGHAATTPAVVAEAALMQCAYVLRSQNAGGAPISGGADFTTTLVAVGLHPFVRRVLDPIRMGFGGIA